MTERLRAYSPVSMPPRHIHSCMVGPEGSARAFCLETICCFTEINSVSAPDTIARDSRFLQGGGYDGNNDE